MAANIYKLYEQNSSNVMWVFLIFLKGKMHDKKSINVMREETTLLQGSYSRNGPASIREIECIVTNPPTK